MILKCIQAWSEPEDWSKNFIQNFDKEKISVTKAGKTFNLYDYIQSQREDTEIYTTLKKYGNLQVMEKNPKQVYEDFTQINDLRSLYEKDKAIEDLFYSLPVEERAIFKNDFYLFKENGLNYYENKAKKEIEQKQKQQQQQQQPDGGNDNEQK